MYYNDSLKIIRVNTNSDEMKIDKQLPDIYHPRYSTFYYMSVMLAIHPQIVTEILYG